MPIRDLAAAAIMLTLPACASAAVFELDILASDRTLELFGASVERLVGTAEIRIADEALARDGWTELDDASFSFILLGQSFTGGDDMYGAPNLEITAGAPSWIRFGVSEFGDGVPDVIDHPWFMEIDVYGSLMPGPDGRRAIVTSLEPHDRYLNGPAPVPLPAGLPLAASALTALVALGRSRRR